MINNKLPWMMVVVLCLCGSVSYGDAGSEPIQGYEAKSQQPLLLAGKLGDLLENLKKSVEEANQKKSSPDSSAKTSQPVSAAEQPSPSPETLSREENREIQQRLLNLGYNPGSADGLPGNNTRVAIQKYQAANNIPIDGNPTRVLLNHLRNSKQVNVASSTSSDIRMSGMVQATSTPASNSSPTAKVLDRPVLVHGQASQLLIARADGTVIGGERGVIELSRKKGLKDIISVSQGAEHNVALSRDGRVLTWGNNSRGQLGGKIRERKTPMPVEGLEQVVAIAAGRNTTVALRWDGTVWTLGDAYKNGSFTEMRNPVRVEGLDSVVKIAAGDLFAVALKADGTVWTWGYNREGQLGDGTDIGRNLPQKVAKVSNITNVAAGSNHALALGADGTVWGWGSNASGQLGDPRADTSMNEPRKIPGLAGIATVAASAGSRSSLAISKNGSLFVWGKSSKQKMPYNVPGISGVIAATSDSNYVYAMTEDGSIWQVAINKKGESKHSRLIDRNSGKEITAGSPYRFDTAHQATWEKREIATKKKACEGLRNELLNADENAKRRSFEKKDFRCLESVSGANLSNYNFANSNFSEVDFSGADVSGSKFNYAKLEGANFNNASLLNTQFHSAKLRKASFNNANLNRTQFYQAELVSASFLNTDLSKTEFRMADVNGADFSGATIGYGLLNDPVKNIDKAIGIQR